jgi:exonuclease III
MKLGTWNVQGCRNKMEEILSEINELKMDVVVLTETKKKRTGSETLENYIHLFSGVNKYKRAKRGVSVLINKKWKSSLRNWESIDERMLKLDMGL